MISGVRTLFLLLSLGLSFSILSCAGKTGTQEKELPLLLLFANTSNNYTNYYPILNSCNAPGTASYLTAANVQYSSASTNNYVAVYTPTSGSNWPLVVWIHGGGWGNTVLMYNNSYTINEIVSPLVAQGYAVASVDHRMSSGLSNPAIMPAQVQDVRCAIMWLRANAGTYNYKVTNLVAMGESAGGQLAGMLAMNVANGTGFDDTVNCGSWAGGTGNAAVHSAVLWYPAVDMRSSSLFTTTSIAGLSCANARACVTAVLGECAGKRVDPGRQCVSYQTPFSGNSSDHGKHGQP